MPLFHFVCEKCGHERRRLLSSSKDAEGQLCEKCGGKMPHDMKGPTTRVVETLDNGIMPKALERLADAERLSRERVEKHKREKDER